MGWTSIGANTVLFGAKLVAGLAVGSVAIVADAWHTLSDSLSSVIVLAGTKTARKPADEEHPFGHGRAELIAAVVVGAFLAVVAFNILVSSIGRLQQGGSVIYRREALIVVAMSVVVKEALAQGAFWVARRAHSPAMRADAWHHRSDAITSILVLIGIGLGGSRPWIDGTLGIVVSLFLLYAATKVLREGSVPLLGETPNRTTLAQMQTIAARVSPQLQQVHHVHIHRYGDHTELTCHVRIDGAMSVDHAHHLVDDYERALREEMQVEPTVHVDPVRGGDFKTRR